MMTAASYPRVLSWFFAHPAEKLHWEWELFLHYLYWSVTINLGISFVLVWFLVSTRTNIFGLTMYGIVVSLSIAFSLTHSFVMAKVHQMYLERARSDQ
jgi:hypothetical protein